MNDAQKQRLRREYVARINRAIDFIDANLAGDLSLQRLAREACFSPFHFHRVFGALVGEPVASHIKRRRLERAAAMLARYPARSITEIALDCGFSGSATFARAFRERFGCSASAYRERKGGQTESKIGKADDKGGKAPREADGYLGRVEPTRTRSDEMKVEIQDLEAMPVAYVRNIGPYDTIGAAFGKLCQWAGPRGLLGGPQSRFVGVYRDDPDVTEPDKLRAEACVTVPAGTETSGEIGSMTIPAGRYAVARFEIAPDGFSDAWQQVMGGWLPESGFEPDDRPCFELYHQTPQDHPEGKFVLDICLPVRPLSD